MRILQSPSRSTLVLIILLSVLVGPLGAQARSRKAPTGTASERYAKVIAATLDVGVREYRRYLDTTRAVRDENFAAAGQGWLAIAGRLERVAGDFDAVVPPPTLARLHEQLRDAALTLAGTVGEMGKTFAGLADPCAGEQPGSGCDAVVRRLALAQRGQRTVGKLARDDNGYVEARNRASRMLALEGVVLPEFPAMP